MALQLPGSAQQAPPDLQTELGGAAVLPNVPKWFGDVSSGSEAREGPQSSRSRLSGDPENVEALIPLK